MNRTDAKAIWFSKLLPTLLRVVSQWTCDGRYDAHKVLLRPGSGWRITTLEEDDGHINVWMEKKETHCSQHTYFAVKL